MTQLTELNQDDRISACKAGRGDLFFHRQSCRAPRKSSVGDYFDLPRPIFRKVKSGHPFEIDDGRFARTPALYLDFAARRRGLRQ